MGPTSIVQMLENEGIKTTRKSVACFIARYKENCRIARKSGSGRPTKITNFVLRIVESRMRDDDETTATQLNELLFQNGIAMSLRTILRGRALLGWTFRGSRYCQLIRDANKLKRHQWAVEHLHDNFANVIWTDETSVQLESHRRFCYRKKGELPTPKPRPKHPLKVHVWAGISMQGPTPVCIFTGTMDAEGYVTILKGALLPFLRTKFANREHRFMQDNDPKHTSLRARRFFKENHVNWWRTPPESPDCNPIENLWYELKEHLRAREKPRTQAELVAGIEMFWNTVTQEKCQKYIRHLQKVLPRVIEVQGDATGY